MFSYSDHPHKIDCDCDWCNNYKANGEKFSVKVKQKLEQTLRKNVIKELTDIQADQMARFTPTRILSERFYKSEEYRLAHAQEVYGRS